MSEQAAPNLAEWQDQVAKTSSITVEQLDAMVADYKSHREAYDASKEVSSALYKKVEEAEGKLIEALEQAGKSKYNVEGIGTVYFSDKLVVPTPKTIAQKTLLFNHIKKQYNEQFLMDKVSINHQTLQSLYNAMFEDFKEKCKQSGEEAATFSVPGLDQPTSQRSLNFRKDK